MFAETKEIAAERSFMIGKTIRIVSAGICLIMWGCGGATTPASPATGQDTSRGEDAGLSGLTPAEVESGYPCSYPARVMMATALAGTFDSPELFCGERGYTDCQIEGPTISYPGADSIFQEARVMKGMGQGGSVVFIAIKKDDSWYFSDPMGAANEIPRHEGPLVTEQEEEYAERLVVYLNLEQKGEGAAILSRSLTVICSTGDSKVPSCITLPESWEHSGESPGSVDVTRLHSICCDDGSVILYGNPTRLPARIAASFDELIGRHHIKFP